jgi:predicted nucleic acid-binding protein
MPEKVCHFMGEVTDSLIVSSALHIEAAVLYSEDIQDGLMVENRMCIMNPFNTLQKTPE